MMGKTTHTSEDPRRASRTAPWFYAATVAVAVAGAFLGSGAIGGTPIQDAAGGWLSADGTVLAPGTGAFSIWSVIYTGLVVHAVIQLLPAWRGSGLQRRLRPWAGASALLNAAWIWVVQWGQLLLSVVVIAVLLAVLARTFILFLRTPTNGRTERLVVGITFGLYLGWVSVATVANTSALLASWGAQASDGATVVVAAAVLAVAAAIGITLAAATGGRLAPAAALAWGLAWIAVGRLDGGTQSVPIAWAAGAAAGLVVAGTLLYRIREARVPRHQLAGDRDGATR
ncbi:tryptophan-rich sensory protein [Arthrobacter sp. JSM 101049]|uniref:tryptophan-rich sensory protein n=1 Tax=Arthrobacter sp. JSM 101049 TaxID=929097 RepID=UPI0035697446